MARPPPGATVLAWRLRFRASTSASPASGATGRRSRHPSGSCATTGRLLVVTDAASYKVKRIRRNPEVTIAPCSARGRLLAEPQPAHAEVLPDSELPRAEALLTGKYRVDTAIFKPIRAVQSALHIGPRRTKPVVLAITLD